MVLIAFSPVQKGYSQESELQCFCAVQAELSDSMLHISAVFRHIGEKDLAGLHYSLELFRKLPGGSVATQQQGGAFTSSPERLNILSETVINVEPGYEISAILHIYRDGMQICTGEHLLFPNENKSTLQSLLERARDTLPGEKEEFLELEIGDLIIDRTISKAGHDFYDLFYQHFEAPRGVTQYMIELEEMPAIGIGSRIRLTVNDLELQTLNMQPRYDFIEEVAIQMAGMAQEYLANYEAIMKQLEGTDQKGTGIY